jgi:hypothetical protein
MAATFEVCTGKVYAFQSSAGNGGIGFYKVSPDITTSGGARIFVTGLPLNYAEIIQPVVSMNDRRLIYTFGSAWEEGQISLLLLLGDSSTKGQAVNDVISWYEENRVSNKKGPVQASSGGQGRDVFVVGMQMGASDPNINTQQMTISTLASIES